MWLSVVRTLIDNDTRHHSGQNVALCRNKFWPLWWRVSLSIRVHTTLNHIRFVFYHNIKHNEINLCLDSWKRRLGFESASAALCKWAACTGQTFLIKPFALICRNNTKKNVWKKSNEVYSLLIRVQTTLNHIRFVFYHNIKDNEINICLDNWKHRLGLKMHALHYAN